MAKKMGRPKIVWTDKEYSSIEYMAIIHCTGEEMAGVMGVDYDTLNRLVKQRYGKTFSEWYKSASSNGNMSLRRLQWKSAEGGNVTMQIFLGKQWLGQKEQLDTNISGDGMLQNILGYMKDRKENE